MLQLIASLALLRALWVILGWRPVLLVPLSFALFTPLALPAFAWWAAALNYLPMVAALAWVCADAILLVRTGNKRYALTAVLAYGAGLSFFEKSAVIPFAAFTVAALLSHVEGDRAAVRTVAPRQAAVAGRPCPDGGLGGALSGGGRPATVELGSVDDLGSAEPLGDPWHRARSGGGPWVCSAGRRPRRGRCPNWSHGARLAGAGGGGGYIAAAQTTPRRGVAGRGRICGCLPGPDLSDALIGLHRTRARADAAISGRSGANADAAGGGRDLRAEPAGPHWLDASGRRTAVAASLTAGFVASSLFSTATFFTSWRDNPTKSYITNAVRGLAAARADSPAPLLDQDVDPLVLQRVVGPESLASHMFALIRDRPEFARSTPG